MAARPRSEAHILRCHWVGSALPWAWISKRHNHRSDLQGRDTGAVVTAEVHAADQGDTATMPDTLANGTPREFIAMASAQLLAILQPDGGLIVMIFVAADNQCAAFAVMIRPIPLG